MSLLKVTDLVVSYGGIEALKGISFEVDQGKIVTLIGANGAGKSTTLRTISGLVAPNPGGSTTKAGTSPISAPRRSWKPGSRWCRKAGACSPT